MPELAKTPVTAANDIAFGTVPWSDVSGGLLPSIQGPGGGYASNWGGLPNDAVMSGLKVGFDFSDLPADAGPVSLTFTVRRKKVSGTVTLSDAAARLVGGSGVVGTEDKSVPGNWSASYEDKTYQFGPLEPADVRAGVGFLLSVKAGPRPPNLDPDMKAKSFPGVDFVSALASW